MRIRSLFAASTVIAAGAAASGAVIDITVENTMTEGGFSFSPVWFGAHNGSFDVFNEGEMASGGIVEIAELADASVLQSRFDSEQPGGASTLFVSDGGPPPFTPGESTTMSFDVGDETTNRFLNYASMVVPSNDLFFGNDNALELFDAAGNFQGPITIDIFGADIWDAGSEVNDIESGPAFVAGADATAGADESENVALFFSRDGADDYLNSILGESTPAGDITQTFGAVTQIGRITIVPAAPTAGVMLLGMTAATRRRRRA